jgi:hypothetical protein
MMQWNILLLASDAVAGGDPADYWDSWREGQATIAPVVQYPGVELGRAHLTVGHSTYTNTADHFLAHHLNGSLRDLEADPSAWYDGALYWQFLVEQYGGMGIVRAALEEMVRFYPPNQDGSEDIAAMQRAMDGAFARVAGPFRDFEESWVAFARATYGLRLANGRCSGAGLTACGGMFSDPDRLYAQPPLEAEIYYAGTAQTYGGAIPVSYGMDFIAIDLDAAVHGQPLTIRLQGEGAVARFSLQLWALASGSEQPLALWAAPDNVPLADDGTYLYQVPRVDWHACQRVALIITRLDGDEAVDSIGAYRVILTADGL